MNTEIELMRDRFHKLVAMLRGFGFQGEVLLKGGLVIVGARDRFSASLIRKGFRGARNANHGTLTEVRGKDGAAAFVWVDDSLALSRQEIRQMALAA